MDTWRVCGWVDLRVELTESSLVASRAERTVYLDATTAVESGADWAETMDACSAGWTAGHSVASRVETTV